MLAPFLRNYIEPALASVLGWLPLFKGPITGIGLLTGGIILAIMVTPIISAVVRDVLAAVPGSQREAALALGATKWEMIRVVLVNGAPGIAGAVILGLGPRARRDDGGDDGHRQPAADQPSLFDPRTRCFGDRERVYGGDDDLYLSALVELGLILFLVTFVVNGIARVLVWNVTRKTGGVGRAA